MTNRVRAIQTSADQAAVIAAITVVGGRPMFVGGIVRDTFMGHVSKDVDIEVFWISFNVMMDAIRRCPAVRNAEVTGVKFQVVTVTTKDGETMDVAMPRREVKTGMGDKGFDIHVDPFMTFKEAAERRDFTMNAMMVDCTTGEVFDFFDGMVDIENGIIHAIGPRFAESPDRMIRAGRFAAQKDFRVGEDVVEMCRAMADRGEFKTIFKDKMREEMIKIAHSRRPSRAFRFFMEARFGVFMPEIKMMQFTEQDVRHHPEGNVFEHTMRVMDEMVRVCDERNVHGEERIIAVFGAVCHDMGKVVTTVKHADGSITSAGHAQSGVAIAKAFMFNMGFENPKMVDRIGAIVRHHMDGIGVTPSARIVRRMAERFAASGGMTMQDFAMITEADASGRDKGHFTPAAGFEAIAIEQACIVAPQRPMIQGRDCMAAGMKPGPAIGKVTRACVEAQIEGVFTDQAGAIAFMMAEIVVQRAG